MIQDNTMRSSVQFLSPFGDILVSSTTTGYCLVLSDPFRITPYEDTKQSRSPGKKMSETEVKLTSIYYYVIPYT
jgi:hypothetical protein